MSEITSKLSERSIEFADLITERGKILNPEYIICRDQPTSRASPLRINVLLSHLLIFLSRLPQVLHSHRNRKAANPKQHCKQETAADVLGTKVAISMKA